VTSRLQRLCARPLAALGGVALIAAAGATPSSGTPAVDGDGSGNSTTDDSSAGTASVGDGTYELCSGLFGFGKAFVGYDVLVDGEEPATPLTRGDDYELLLTGDLDGSGSATSCVPEELTEAAWDDSVFGPSGAAIPFPGPGHLVLPFPQLTTTSSASVTPSAVVPGPFTLSVIDLAATYEAVVGEKPVENSATLPAVLARSENVAADIVGADGVAAIATAVADQRCFESTAAQEAALDLYNSMDEVFRDDWMSLAGLLPDNCNGFYPFVQEYYPQRWVSYLLGTSALAVFDLTVPGPGPTPGPTPAPDISGVTPRFTG
jgi:hypothetical protein